MTDHLGNPENSRGPVEADPPRTHQDRPGFHSETSHSRNMTHRRPRRTVRSDVSGTDHVGNPENSLAPAEADPPRVGRHRITEAAANQTTPGTHRIHRPKSSSGHAGADPLGERRDEFSRDGPDHATSRRLTSPSHTVHVLARVFEQRSAVRTRSLPSGCSQHQGRGDVRTDQFTSA